MVDYAMKTQTQNKEGIEPTRVAGSILWLLGLVKWVTIVAGYNALDMRDPVTGLDFLWLFVVLGAVEIVIGTLALFSTSRKVSGWLISAFAIGAMAYHGVHANLGGQIACPCLGFLTDWIPLTKEDQSELSLGLAVWMWLIGIATLVTEMAVPVEGNKRTANGWMSQ